MKPKACKTCGQTFEPWRPSQSFCSSVCYGESRKGPRKSGVLHRTKLAKGHPIAPPSGRVAVARLALYDKIGGGPHKCHWCGMEVDWGAERYAENALIADHLDWDSSNDTPGNLVPSCNLCNSHRRKKGGSSPIQDGELTMVWSGVRTRAVKRFCNTCGEEFLTIPAEVKKGKGRYCSMSCARRSPRSSS